MAADTVTRILASDGFRLVRRSCFSIFYGETELSKPLFKSILVFSLINNLVSFNPWHHRT